MKPKLNRFHMSKVESTTYKVLYWLHLLAIEEIYRLIKKGVE